MLDSIRFTQGAVAKKDYAPELTHFRIKNGTIRGFNGMIGLHSPIDFDLEVSPRAVPFIKAVHACKDTIQLHVTPAGKLAVRSGKFKAFVECLIEEFPDIPPSGEVIPLTGGILDPLKKLAPFIAEDASRPWARGILLDGQSAFATNNLILVEYWLGYNFPVRLNLPRAAVMELLRINEEPRLLQVDENSCTFHFEGDRWLRSTVYATAWPDIRKVLDIVGNLKKVPASLWEAITDLLPFTDDLGKIHLSPGLIETHIVDGNGASTEVQGLEGAGIFNAKQLLLLEKIVEKIDFSNYPQPCPFVGDRLRGVIMGMRS
jgi:DNA polymerase III sliding clamp (beta) subunit (PCNA family)